jgi:hypothetical protein
MKKPKMPMMMCDHPANKKHDAEMKACGAMPAGTKIGMPVSEKTMAIKKPK